MVPPGSGIVGETFASVRALTLTALNDTHLPEPTSDEARLRRARSGVGGGGGGVHVVVVVVVVVIVVVVVLVVVAVAFVVVVVVVAEVIVIVHDEAMHTESCRRSSKSI